MAEPKEPKEGAAKEGAPKAERPPKAARKADAKEGAAPPAKEAAAKEAPAAAAEGAPAARRAPAASSWLRQNPRRRTGEVQVIWQSSAKSANGSAKRTLVAASSSGLPMRRSSAGWSARMASPNSATTWRKNAFEVWNAARSRHTAANRESLTIACAATR